MRYNPFDRKLSEIQPNDLLRLKEAAEGWYIEYKSRPIAVKDVAKSLSSFANQYGGWLFFGISESLDGSRTAGSFAGLALSDVNAVEASLRDACRDCVHPPVFYETRVIKGPSAEIGLAESRGILIARIPPGTDTPYVHSDGRVYRRIADSSAPAVVHERNVLDLLWQRGQTARQRLETLSTSIPELSATENSGPYLNVFISHDPLEQSGRHYPSDWSKTLTVVKGGVAPFDTVYPRSGGFVARQAKGNTVDSMVFTWRFYKAGHSSFTIPISYFDYTQPSQLRHLREWLSGYQQEDAFCSFLANARIGRLRVLDLNFLLFITLGVASQHRTLLELDGVVGPFYVKAQLGNILRCTPFFDLPTFIAQIEEHGLPVVQDSTALCPPGTELESFTVLPHNQSDQAFQDGFTLSVPLWLALGIHSTKIAESLREMPFTGDRAKIAQDRRNASTSE